MNEEMVNYLKEVIGFAEKQYNKYVNANNLNNAYYWQGIYHAYTTILDVMEKKNNGNNN